MISLLLDLFWTFLIIGIFNFGGGGAMISLIQSQVVTAKGWISEEVFANIIAVSQTTPGPIGINCATYVGYQVMSDRGFSDIAAISGSVASTTAIVLPSFLIFFALIKFYSKFHTSPVFRGVMDALTPAVAGMIGAAALILTFHISIEDFIPRMELVRSNFADWRSWALFGAAFAATMWTRISPIWVILISGVIGILIF
ncbi:MAG: chromate transporter [Bacteroidales bacterium]|nr:chromate transporter [Bacteroidales bacterium]